MKKRILWIEDDYYAIKGLVRPLEKAGFVVEAATSAIDGFNLAVHWELYDVIVVDLILPLSNDNKAVPEKVSAWQKEDHVGVGIMKWLLLDLKVKCPVMLLSVVRNPAQTYKLDVMGLAAYLPKRGLLPTQVKAEIFRLLGISSDAPDAIRL
jgi:CheY-like chemotaxis protein